MLRSDVCMGLNHLYAAYVCPSPSLASLLQKHSLTGVTSIEVYVSDVIARRIEKVKNGHDYRFVLTRELENKMLRCLVVIFLRCVNVIL
jgi:hypothetical protein